MDLVFEYQTPPVVVNTLCQPIMAFRGMGYSKGWKVASLPFESVSNRALYAHSIRMVSIMTDGILNKSMFSNSPDSEHLGL